MQLYYRYIRDLLKKDRLNDPLHFFILIGEKPFACVSCGKSFRQKAHLAKHYQTHLAQKNTLSTKGSKQSQQTANQSQTTHSPHQMQQTVLTNGTNIMR